MIFHGVYGRAHMVNDVAVLEGVQRITIASVHSATISVLPVFAVKPFADGPPTTARLKQFLQFLGCLLLCHPMALGVCISFRFAEHVKIILLLFFGTQPDQAFTLQLLEFKDCTSRAKGTGSIMADQHKRLALPALLIKGKKLGCHRLV